MDKTATAPATLVEAVRYFADPDVCLSFLVSLRWPDGVVRCPTCGSDRVTFLRNQRRWKCYGKHPRPLFTIKAGTILEDSPLGLDKWLPGDLDARERQERHQLLRVFAGALGITQKSAWFMLAARRRRKNGSPSN